MKLAVLGDLHLDRPFPSAGVGAGRRWRSALRQTLSLAIEASMEEGAIALLILGDTYEHDVVAADTGAFLRQQLGEAAGLRVLVAAGDCDHLCPSSIWAQTDWTGNVSIFPRDRWEAIEVVDGLTVWGISHGQPHGTPNLLSRLRAGRPGVQVAAFHGTWADSPVLVEETTSGASFDQSDMGAAAVDQIFVSHQGAPYEQDRITCVGNPCPLGFGESGQGGLVIADIDAVGRVTTTTRSVATYELHELALDLTAVASANGVAGRWKQLLQGRRGGARVMLAGDLDPAVDLRVGDLLATPGQLDFVVVDRAGLRVTLDVEALAEELTVRGQFVRDVRAAPDFDDATREAVLVTGLRALEDRADLAVI
jgi:hypothetical protein